jgi:hypothetical protein
VRSADNDTITDQPSISELEEMLSKLELAECANSKDKGGNLQDVVQCIGSRFLCEIKEEQKSTPHEQQFEESRSCIICNILDLQQRARLVQCHMGSMAQCRGARGDELRNAGAISAVLEQLWRLMLPLHNSNQWIPQLSHSTVATGTIAYNRLSLLPSTNELLHSDTNFTTQCSKHKHLTNGYLFPKSMTWDALHSAALDLTNSCLGALRDLSCGSSLSRSAILDWTTPFTISLHYTCNGEKRLQVHNGIHLICAYMLRYHKLRWDDVLSLNECNSVTTNDSTTLISVTERGKKELRLLTNALGAIRNTSHSTPGNCQAFFECGLTDLLVWRLCATLNHPEDGRTNNATNRTPLDNTRYWREAKYRAAGSLINLAEKCPSVACQLGSDRQLILLLIETWGGAKALSSDPKKLKSIPLLHLGLAAILRAADDGALEGGLDDCMKRILEKEQIRKKIAQKKEDERKKDAVEHHNTYSCC